MKKINTKFLATLALMSLLWAPGVVLASPPYMSTIYFPDRAYINNSCINPGPDIEGLCYSKMWNDAGPTLPSEELDPNAIALSHGSMLQIQTPDLWTDDLAAILENGQIYPDTYKRNSMWIPWPAFIDCAKTTATAIDENECVKNNLTKMINKTAPFNGISNALARRTMIWRAQHAKISGNAGIAATARANGKKVGLSLFTEMAEPPTETLPNGHRDHIKKNLLCPAGDKPCQKQAWHSYSVYMTKLVDTTVDTTTILGPDYYFPMAESWNILCQPTNSLLDTYCPKRFGDLSGVEVYSQLVRGARDVSGDIKVVFTETNWFPVSNDIANLLAIYNLNYAGKKGFDIFGPSYWTNTWTGVKNEYWYDIPDIVQVPGATLPSANTADKYLRKVACTVMPLLTATNGTTVPLAFEETGWSAAYESSNSSALNTTERHRAELQQAIFLDYLASNPFKRMTSPANGLIDCSMYGVMDFDPSNTSVEFVNWYMPVDRNIRTDAAVPNLQYDWWPNFDWKVNYGPTISWHQGEPKYIEGLMGDINTNYRAKMVSKVFDYHAQKSQVNGEDGRNEVSTDVYYTPIPRGTNQLADDPVSFPYTFSRPFQFAVASDTDGDGYADVATWNQVTGDGYQYLMNGNNLRVPSPNKGSSFSGYSPTGYTKEAVGDFNGDDTQDVLLRNKATGEWTILEYAVGSPSATATVVHNPDPTGFQMTTDLTDVVAAVADVNNDGAQDIVLRSSDINNPWWKIYFLHGAIVLPASGQSTQPQLATSTVKAAADFNGDGIPDVLFRNADLTWSLYELNSDASILRTTDVSMASAGWDFAGAGDFNADGIQDVLLRNTTTGAWYEYSFNSYANVNIANPVTRFKSSGAVGLKNNLAWEVFALADIDNTGSTDVVLYRSSDQKYFLYGMGGETGRTVVGATVLPITTGSGAAWDYQTMADYNGDGKLDFLFRNTTNGRWYMYGFSSYTADDVWSFNGYAKKLSTNLDEQIIK